VYLFGSWAQGRALAASDLDIALDAGRPIEPAIIQKIADAMDELPTLRKIDVVDLQAVDREFRQRVLQQGELIYGQ
jgi:predicted nucleotidyltransferase